MKNKIKYGAILIALASCLFTSCKEEFLDVTNKTNLSAETVFADEKGADIFLNSVYGAMPDAEAPPGYNYDPVEDWSDNAVNRFQWAISWVKGVARVYGPADNNPGLYNHDYPAMPFKYDKQFSNIRMANVFLKNLSEKSANYSEAFKKTRIAEARFLRAFFYHWLYMGYGGVPIVTNVLSRNEQGDSIFIGRSTGAQTLKFIQDECTAAAADLPNEVGKGRATKGAALAVKAWSEMFSRDYAAAAATYQQIMALGTYSLFSDYNTQFMGENNNNVESIWAYQHVAASKYSGRTYLFGPPPVSASWANMMPTQNLVDDYLMSDGLPKELSPLWNPKNPYANRDPRFEKSIIHDGTLWQGKIYNMKQGGEYARDPGKERNSGYYRKKGIDERLTASTIIQDASNYVYFRYADVLLGYAEAKMELNQIDQSVIDAIDKVRVRGGIPKLSVSYSKSSFDQSELRSIVRRERKIELAFENRAYWDLIRWRTAEVVLNQPVYGIDIIPVGDGTYNYNKVLIHNMTFYPAKNYLFPIWQGWIDKNPVIKAQNGGPDNWVNGQNPGY
jgi:hypothetical protein